MPPMTEIVSESKKLKNENKLQVRGKESHQIRYVKAFHIGKLKV